MTAPIAVPSDLGVYLKDSAIDTVRATQSLLLAQDLCATIWSALDATALGTVLAVAGRQYTNVASATTVGLGSGHIGYGTTGPGMGVGGLYLSRSDIRTLRRLAGRSGAFSIDLLPDPYPPVTP